MHEFVLSMRKLRDETGVTAADVAKALIDRGIHPPTMYFPLIVEDALMFEPTETVSKETLDAAADALGIPVSGSAYDRLRTISGATGIPVPPQLAGLEDAPVRFDEVIGKTEIARFVSAYAAEIAEEHAK